MQSPDLFSLYPALHAQAQACTSALLIKWLYFGSLLASHTRHAASDSVPHAPRYSPAGHPDVVHDVQDAPDLQYPSSQVHEQLSASHGRPDVVYAECSGFDVHPSQAASEVTPHAPL